MAAERRTSARIPVGIYVQQFVHDEPHRCFLTDLSQNGVYMERLVEPLERRTNIVQLELSLPGTGGTLWTAGEVVYDCFDALFHGTAVRFTAMARGHRRTLDEWIEEARRALFHHEGSLAWTQYGVRVVAT